MNKKAKWLCIGAVSTVIIGYLSIGAKLTEEEIEAKKLEGFKNNVSRIDIQGDFKEVLEKPNFDGRAVEAIGSTFTGNRQQRMAKKDFTIQSGEELNQIYKVLPDYIKTKLAVIQAGGTAMNLNRFEVICGANKKTRDESELISFDAKIGIEEDNGTFKKSMSFYQPLSEPEFKFNERKKELLKLLDIDIEDKEKIDRAVVNYAYEDTIYENSSTGQKVTVTYMEGIETLRFTNEITKII